MNDETLEAARLLIDFAEAHAGDMETLNAAAKVENYLDAE